MKGEHSYPLPLVLRPKPVRLHFLRNTKNSVFFRENVPQHAQEESLHPAQVSQKPSIFLIVPPKQVPILFQRQCSSEQGLYNYHSTALNHGSCALLLPLLCRLKDFFLILRMFSLKKKQNLTKWDKEAQSNTHPLFPFLAEWFVQNLVLQTRLIHFLGIAWSFVSSQTNVFEVNSFVHKTPAELLVTRTLTGRLSQGVTQPVVCCWRGDDVFPVFKRRTEGSQSTGARGCLGPEHRRSFSTERVLGK